MATSASVDAKAAAKAAGKEKEQARRALKIKLSRFPHHLPWKYWTLFVPSGWKFGNPLVQPNKKTLAELEKLHQSWEEMFPGYVVKQIEMTERGSTTSEPTDVKKDFPFSHPEGKENFEKHAFQLCTTPSGKKALIVLFISENDEFCFSEFQITKEEMKIRPGRFGREIFLVISFVFNDVEHSFEYFPF